MEPSNLTGHADVTSTGASLTTPHLPRKAMTWLSPKVPAGRPPIQGNVSKLCSSKSHVSEERRRAWELATATARNGPASLRFPVYERLYNLNVCAQQMVDLVGEISSRLSPPPDDILYHQHLIQQIRSSVTSDVLDRMGDVEHIESWLFENLRRTEEMNLRDPEDAYLMVGEQEQDRIRAGKPPRVQFLDGNGGSREAEGTAAKVVAKKPRASRNEKAKRPRSN
ncbi:hypothetical protein SAMN05421819_3992 [Bryocella elongata]|uniref:Uncharacterized protein n=1 Tax=Bryocella elongata TaxID=863522 RepID=A0A1H6BTR3_9BACT|nr:hypothetical protein [Bryocella elongata]SEG63606.1 hypothetical protein SAMN05421819_3992 [Bryocella elongata]